jgi:hypothetical protein
MAMPDQAGFFDVDERYAALARSDHSLIRVTLTTLDLIYSHVINPGVTATLVFERERGLRRGLEIALQSPILS